MKIINWSPLLKNYAGKWVALKSDEETVVAVSENAKKAFNDAKKTGLKIPILLKVPKESLPYIG